MSETVTILVIEDDLGLADLIREEFTLRGWSTAHCASGKEALAWLASHEPTLVLLDYSLPDMTGAALLEQVALPAFIVTTGAGDERIAVEMMKKGALDYLVKDGLFLDTLPRVVELAIHHVGTERRLAQAEARLRETRESLRRAQKMESLGLMAGGIAHDFNNLFQGLQGNLEGALRTAPEGSQRAFLDKALAILARASTLTHRMLDFTGKGFRKSQWLEIGAVLQAGLEALPTDSGPGVKVEVEPGLPALEGDENQLGQVLSAFLRNALEAQKFAGGPIRLAASLSRPEASGPGVWVQVPPSFEPAICVTVADAGTGMTKEVLERAFDPFFTTRKSGRGLGLSAALGILRGHDAGLWVATAPGQGTTFRIYFTPATDRTEAPEPLLTDHPRQRTILLVDDDEDLQETLGEFLRDILGYPLLQARDGFEAVSLYRQEQARIGLVLMDATMPRMAGPEAFKAILQLNPQAKGILCSGFSEEIGTRTAHDCGFLGFLKKPFPLKTLEEALTRALGS